jgi:glycerophosphoryl diester phosphodiesterase
MRPALPPAFTRLPLTHRALHDAAQGRPENSPAAIRAAIDAGYGIEIDVQCSRDGAAMVFHDEALSRLTGRGGMLADHLAADLRQIPLLGGGGDTIPTLPEILSLIAGRVPLLIEIKDQTGEMAPSDGQLECAVAQALANYIGPVAVMSFNPHSVAVMAELAPKTPRGLTTSAYDYADWHPLPHTICDELREIPDYDRVRASFISHEAADLARPRVAQLRSQGAAILCWTIKSPSEEEAARKVADNITFERYLAPIA